MYNTTVKRCYTLFFRLDKKTLGVITLALLVFTVSVTLTEVNALLVVAVSPSSGTQGTVVQITGSGFTPNGQIKASLWNGKTTSTFKADVNGNLNTTVTVPAVAKGLYAINVTDASSGKQTSTSFIVTQSSLPTPTTPEIPLPVFVLALLAVVSLTGALLALRKRAQPQ